MLLICSYLTITAFYKKLYNRYNHGVNKNPNNNYTINCLFSFKYYYIISPKIYIIFNYSRASDGF